MARRFRYGLNHVTLDGAWPHDCYLDCQVVAIARLQARQHVHLGAAFHLEHANCVCPAQHVVGRLVILGQAGKKQLLVLAAWRISMNKVEGLADAGQHAQRQHIDFHDLQRVEIVLVPFDKIAVVHGGGADGHCPVQLVAGQHEAADMLGQVPRKSHDRPGEMDRARHRCILRIAFALDDLVLFQIVAVMSPHRVGQLAGNILGQAEHLAHFAYGAARAVVNDGSGKCRAAMAITAIDILNDFLAALMLKIHVDIRRFPPVRVEEALEQNVDFCRINRSDAECEADHGIGGAAASLAENVLRAGKHHDVVHGEKVMCDPAVSDER